MNRFRRSVLFLYVLGFGLALLAPLRAEPADDLRDQGDKSLAAHDFATATSDYEQLIKNYPSRPYIPEVKLKLAQAYFYANNYDKTISTLAEFLPPTATPETRPVALYYTGLAQLYSASKVDPQSVAAKQRLTQAVATFTTLLTSFPRDPAAEDALYNRALAYYQSDNLDKAEADIRQILAQFPQSLNRANYQLLLGNLYGRRVAQAQASKQPPATVQDIAQKGLAIYDQIAQGDPSAVLTINDAARGRADLLTLVADPSDVTANQKAIAAYRKIQPKDALIPLQAQRIKTLIDANAATLQANPHADTSSQARIIQSEQAHLAEVQNGPDPVIYALEQMAFIYNRIKEPDEARTVLHRLIRAGLPVDQQQAVDLQMIQSYLLTGDPVKLNQALDAYEKKYPGDVQVDSISAQLAQLLLSRQDNDGAIREATRSVTDFPKGSAVALAASTAAQAYNNEGKPQEAENFLKKYGNTNSPDSLYATADAQAKKGDLPNALNNFRKVMGLSNAGLYGEAAAVQVINILSQQKQNDQVLAEVKKFVAKYPKSTSLVGVQITGALAQNQMNDSAGALASLDNLVKTAPQDPTIPYALYTEITIYEKLGKLSEAAQTLQTLSTKYPQATDYIPAAAQLIGQDLEAQKKFTEAIALYQPLNALPNQDLAAYFQNKVGDTWLASAASLGAYQSMQNTDDRKAAENQVNQAQTAYLNTLTNFPNVLAEVGNAIDGLLKVLKQRETWGLIQPSDYDKELAKDRDAQQMPEIKARLEMARIGLAVDQNDVKKFPAALAAYQQVIDQNSGIKLTRQETVQIGQLLIAGKDYARANDFYNILLTDAKPTDAYAQVDGLFGLASVYLAQNDWNNARQTLNKVLALNPNWHPKYADIQYSVALVAEKTGDASTAKTLYTQVMQDPNTRVELKAKSMLGYGHILEKEGHGLKQPTQQDNEYAVYYYTLINIFFAPGVPDLGAEGLYDALHLYLQAGDRANAQAQMDALKPYATSSPTWYNKAKAEFGG